MIPQHKWIAQVFYQDAESGETDIYTKEVYTETQEETEAEWSVTTPCTASPFETMTLLHLVYAGREADPYENVAFPF